jgi:hypothetical protein
MTMKSVMKKLSPETTRVMPITSQLLAKGL